MKEELAKKVHENRKNLIVTGEIASGKTKEIIFPIVKEMIAHNESLFILDSKEEYINEFYNELKSRNYNVIILNLRDLEKSVGWNPLEYAKDLYRQGNIDKAQEYIERSMRTIVYENSTGDPFWEFSSRDLLTGISLAILDEPDEKININSIAKILTSSSPQTNTEYLDTLLRSKGESHAQYIYGATALNAPRDTKAGIISVATQKLRPYTSRELLSRLLSKTTFKYKDMLTKPTAVFMIARDEVTLTNTLISMFIEEIYNYLIDNKYKYNFNFILDNFDNIDRICELENMMSSAPSRNGRWIIGTRSYKTITNKYGSYIAKLSDTINVKNKTIEIILNNETEVIDKSFKKKAFQKSNIKYPKLTNNTPDTIDITVKNQPEEPIKVESKLEPKKPVVEVSPIIDTEKIDELIKSIDDKIQQIEEQENPQEIFKPFTPAESYTDELLMMLQPEETEPEPIETSKETYINSELQQFKIED